MKESIFSAIRSDNSRAIPTKVNASARPSAGGRLSSRYHKVATHSPEWGAPASQWLGPREREPPDMPYDIDMDSYMLGTTGRTKTVGKQQQHEHVLWNGRLIPRLQFRLYLSYVSYVHVKCLLTSTVSEIISKLDQSPLLGGTKETHSIYVKERELDETRACPRTYRTTSRLETLYSDDIGFLIKFVYKCIESDTEEEQIFDKTFELIELTGRSLKTIPIALHTHAEKLRFASYVSRTWQLRRYPRASDIVSLRRLDISCNRITDLDDSGLNQIPELANLNAYNNKINKLPKFFSKLRSLKSLDISNNKFVSMPTVIHKMTNLVDLDIDFNSLSSLPPEIGLLKSLRLVVVVGNQIANFPNECTGLISLVSLDCRRNNISDLLLISKLHRLQQLLVDHNAVRTLDLVVGPCIMTSHDISYAKLSSLDDNTFLHFTALETLRIDHNAFRYIPETLGLLTRLVTLTCSDNQIEILPESIGNLQRLGILDAHNNNFPIEPFGTFDTFPDVPSVKGPQPKRLYLRENRLSKEALYSLMMLRELHVLNLSFNNIRELPSSFFRNLISLEEIYLSGNKFSTIPTEDLIVLPSELNKLKRLMVLDVGSNVLNYNVNNWEYDWNWKFNPDLKYLNFSGNMRSKLQPDWSRMTMAHHQTNDRKGLANFSEPNQLRILGLMDVLVTMDIPDDDAVHRVRTSPSEVNHMAYGIANTPGTKDNFGMFDIVVPTFRGQNDECIFAMFRRFDTVPRNSHVSKFLCDNFVKVFSHQLEKLDKNAGETIQEALRRTFLSLIKDLHAFLMAGPNFNSEVLYSEIINGDCIVPHERPFDVTKWSQKVGSLLMDCRKSSPGIVVWELSELDELIIIANCGLWDYISYQTAVDIARSEKDDSMIAAQKLRDIAISYGANGSTMVMVISVSDLFEAGSLAEMETYLARKPKRKPKPKAQDIGDVQLSRLPQEMVALTGHITLVLTDIRNSMHLWDTNAGMPAAMRLHNQLFRRQLRLCGGYEVKLMGDAFMCSFQSVFSALK
ncbi:hypothetical protein EW145_g2933 [Phellinidium pouzarii]|uniref:PPM-type phosphatase domain-containing protein n=1 Tax=Phellinidium pouzarii TaxID=167371 RepID=A0A4S4LEJ9_9AGAM|nr:hypothetical protein EW145_g2933 [Phellinidium pouzarii]